MDRVALSSHSNVIPAILQECIDIILNAICWLSTKHRSGKRLKLPCQTHLWARSVKSLFETNKKQKTKWGLIWVWSNRDVSTVVGWWRHLLWSTFRPRTAPRQRSTGVANATMFSLQSSRVNKMWRVRTQNNCNRTSMEERVSRATRTRPTHVPPHAPDAHTRQHTVTQSAFTKLAIESNEKLQPSTTSSRRRRATIALTSDFHLWPDWLYTSHAVTSLLSTHSDFRDAPQTATKTRTEMFAANFQQKTQKIRKVKTSAQFLE